MSGALQCTALLMQLNLLLSAHLLSGQTEHKTPINWPPLLSGCGHLLVILMRVFYCFYPYLMVTQNLKNFVLEKVCKIEGGE